ncbi:lysozyme [Bradyrhizobium stylosanthis]|uniref:Lysozyme n=1 Tax=Bradyrhizobium stylosanthis TaxID=1803665 RepID=A0A560CXL6_9BRAD|nr:lysozyme [Bradyrhizobium stylosanthis]TWA89599.1 lysozyme [Bradyrhizobium stylosanthis]
MSVKKTAGYTGSAAVIAATVAFLPAWEGMDAVAKKDMIGTGHPVTYCYGQTAEFGKVKEGTRFTKAECDQKLAESLPKYLEQIQPCIKVPLPVKTEASLVDAAYNAGPRAVCRSPMLAKMNAGDLAGGCRAFRGWYTRSDGQERRGLIARRSGIGDGRKSEMALCLEGVAEGLPKPPAPAKRSWFAWLWKQK